MNWYTGMYCTRPGCDDRPVFVRLLKDTKYNYVYPITLCFDCKKFLNLKDNRIGL